MKKVKRHMRKGRKAMVLVGIIGIIPGVVIATVGVLFLAGVVDIVSYSPNKYEASFYNEGMVISHRTYYRGETLVVPTQPTKADDENYHYTFVGWDITGDHFADIVPLKVYGPISAYAVYSKTKVNKL